MLGSMGTFAHCAQTFCLISLCNSTLCYKYITSLQNKKDKFGIQCIVTSSSFEGKISKHWLIVSPPLLFSNTHDDVIAHSYYIYFNVPHSCSSQHV